MNFFKILTILDFFLFSFSGFNSSEEAKHVAEITEKLANFDIETDTETIFMQTDTG